MAPSRTAIARPSNLPLSNFISVSPGRPKGAVVFTQVDIMRKPGLLNSDFYGGGIVLAEQYTQLLWACQVSGGLPINRPAGPVRSILPQRSRTRFATTATRGCS